MVAEQRRQGWFCAGCCYFLYTGLFAGLVLKNGIQLVIFIFIQPNLWLYFIVMCIAWGVGGLIYCITGCCNAASMAKFLDPICMVFNLGFSAFGAAVFFGNPLLSVISGQSDMKSLTLTPKNALKSV